jgi:hypothetical protein
MDVRAMGCLLEELVACCDDLTPPLQAMSTLAQACLHTDASRRPGAEELAQRLLASLGGA